MTIILISTKTLIKKKKRESWGEKIESKLSGIYLELLECIWKWSYPVQKKNAAISSWKRVAGVLQHLPQL